MSSDEKALKQICYCGHPKERHFDRWVLNNEIVNGSLGVVGCNHCGCREYAHNELLDTHTVKEELCRICEYSMAEHKNEDHAFKLKEEPTTPEKSMTLPDGKEVSTSYSEIFDQDGKSIKGITAIHAFNGAIIVATANKMYCDKPEILKTSSSFEEVSTPEKKCCFNCGIGSEGCKNNSMSSKEVTE